MSSRAEEKHSAGWIRQRLKARVVRDMRRSGSLMPLPLLDMARRRASPRTQLGRPSGSQAKIGSGNNTGAHAHPGGGGQQHSLLNVGDGGEEWVKERSVVVKAKLPSSTNQSLRRMEPANHLKENAHIPRQLRLGRPCTTRNGARDSPDRPTKSLCYTNDGLDKRAKHVRVEDACGGPRANEASRVGGSGGMCRRGWKAKTVNWNDVRVGCYKTQGKGPEGMLSSRKSDMQKGG